MKFPISILLLLISNLGFCQQFSVREIGPLTGSESILDCIKHQNGMIYSTGYASSGNFGYWDAIFTIMNLNDSITSRKVFGDSLYNLGVEVKILKDSNLLLIIDGTDANKGWTSLVKLDQFGIPLWEKSILETNSTLYLRYLYDNADTICLYGAVGNLNKYGAVVGINSITGDLIFSNKYSIFNQLSTEFVKGEKIAGTDISFILCKSVLDSISLQQQAYLAILHDNRNISSLMYVADSCNFKSPMLAIANNLILLGVNNYRNVYPAENYILCLFDSTGQILFSKEVGPGILSTSFSDAVFDSVNGVFVLSNNLNIYIIDLSGNIIESNNAYWDFVNPPVVGEISSLCINKDTLYGFGVIKNNSSLPSKGLYIHAPLNGVGCMSNPITNTSIVDFPLNTSSQNYFSDTLSTLSAINSIQYSTLSFQEVIYCQATNLNDWEDNNVLIFPNPIVDKITVETNWNAGFTTRIFDIQGRLLESYHFNSRTANIGLNHLHQGVFLIEVSKDIEKVLSKLIKL